MGDQGRQAAERCRACCAYGWHVEGCPVARHAKLVTDLRRLADELDRDGWLTAADALRNVLEAA